MVHSHQMDNVKNVIRHVDNVKMVQSTNVVVVMKDSSKMVHHVLVNVEMDNIKMYLKEYVLIVLVVLLAKMLILVHHVKKVKYYKEHYANLNVIQDIITTIISVLNVLLDVEFVKMESLVLNA